MPSPARFNVCHHHVGAVLRAAVALTEQCARRAHPGCVAHVNPQMPAGCRSPAPFGRQAQQNPPPFTAEAGVIWDAARCDTYRVRNSAIAVAISLAWVSRAK